MKKKLILLVISFSLLFGFSNAFGEDNLLQATAQGDEVSVKSLLAAGAAVDMRDEIGKTPLIIAAEKGYLPIVELLIENSADVNAQNNLQWTALMFAAGSGHFEIAKLLIEKGADLNAVSKSDYTALILASAGGHPRIVELLLEKGADATIKKNDLTAQQWAEKVNEAEVIKIFENTSQHTSKDLHIFIKTDKNTYSKGDEIHFTILFENVTTFPLRVLIDSEFVGSNIKCLDSDGNEYTYEGGYTTWSPKAGVFTGGTHLIKPNSKLEIKMDALLYDNYSLIFSNLFDRQGSSGFQEIKSSNNLPGDFPDKYICAGRIFKLQKAGNYRFTYIYQTTENDKNWKFVKATDQEESMDFLWIGRTESNTIGISIK